MLLCAVACQWLPTIAGQWAIFEHSQVASIRLTVCRFSVSLPKIILWCEGLAWGPNFVASKARATRVPREVAYALTPQPSFFYSAL